MKNKRNNYTLTEILVVIIILAVVLAIALPGFNNLVNGNKTMRAAKQLATVFQQARAEAIVSGCRVVLLFPCRRPDNSTGDTSNIRSNYSNASYGMLVYEKNGNFDFGSERNSNFKWQRLPSGVIISLMTDEASYTPGNSSASTDDEYFSENNSMRILYSTNNLSVLNSWLNDNSSSNAVRSIHELEGDSDADIARLGTKLRREFSRAFQFSSGSTAINNSHMVAIEFNPDGTVRAPGFNINVFLTEGYVDSNGNLHATRPNTNTSATNYQGRPFNSSGFLYNRFTGRVRYYEDAYL